MLTIIIKFFRKIANKIAVITVDGFFFFPQEKHAGNTGEMKGLKTE